MSIRSGLILALVIVACVAALLWQGLSHAKQVSELEQQAAQYRAEVEAEKLAGLTRLRQLEGAFNDTYQTALYAASDRDRALRSDLAAVRDASAGLRAQAADAARRLAQATAPAVLEYANTLGVVFAECQTRYGELAAQADGHASDARTLIEAWPSYEVSDSAEP